MRKLLSQGFSRMNIAFEERMADQFCSYADFLQEYNQKVNLTAISEPEEVAVKHFLDCASLLTVIPVENGAKVIDVGSGAGFPGLVLKILRPDLRLTLLDSLLKRIEFLKQCADLLGLGGITFVHARAEDAGRNPDLREKYDVAAARAVASMQVLGELCLPFVRVGGVFAALKGPALAEEIAGAASAINILGGEPPVGISADIPFSELSHHIAIVKKVRQTPTKYPRKAGVPSKSPIK